MRKPPPLLRSIVLGLAGALLAAASSQAAAPEVRGTWLTTTNSTHLSAGNIGGTMSTLRDIGLNTVYVESFKNGYTNFPSTTLANFTGSSSLNPTLGGRDLLASSTAAARNAGLVHYAWFEYGLSAGFGDPNNPLANKCRDNGWLLQDSTGAYTNASNGYSWMNPLVPQVRDLMKGMVIEAIDKYGLQGVQFDDRLSWPVEFGYDSVTRAAYLAETGRNLPSSPTNTQFSNWRRQKMQAFASELYTAIKTARPGVMVSLAPSIQSFSFSNYMADWSSWAAAGLFDEIVPQAYRSTIADFNAIWPAQVAAVGASRKSKMSGGLRINGTGAATPWADLQQMLLQCRADGVGHSLWYSEGVFGTAGYRSQLTAFYDVANQGYAANPYFLAVPEPATLLCAAGLGVLALRRRCVPA
jgi:uncharacterized lipoprotein YddW (UPF0748 family)